MVVSHNRNRQIQKAMDRDYRLRDRERNRMKNKSPLNTKEGT